MQRHHSGAVLAFSGLCLLGFHRIASAQSTPPAPAVPAAPAAPASAEPASCALPSPLDSPPFPNSDWTVPVVGANEDAPLYPLQKALFGNKLDSSRTRIYGWLDIGGVASNSKHSATPVTYAFDPNKLLIDQVLLRVERLPDTVQTTHTDFGYRITGIYGSDYRFTTAKGWFSDQLLQHNNLYGFDTPELWGQVYLPHIAQGTVVTVGRYISPLDIEAQWAPNNYLYTHSVMFSYDPYTFTGANAEFKLNQQWLIHFGVHAGNDMAPWVNSARLNFELLVGYNTRENRDSFWYGVDSIGPSGKYEVGHDNLQVLGGTWGHQFSNRFHMQTEEYYIYQYDAAMGGTAIYGPTESYASGGGPGPIIPGKTYSIGAVNYLEYKLGDKDYASYRTDTLYDPQGQRTGYPNHYYSFTLGYSRTVTPLTTLRPEIRYDYASTNPAYDNGTRKHQYTIGGDIIQHF